MPKQTPQQFAAFQDLCRANHLDPKADVWQQKQSGQWIIGRTGIEKIQGLNNIGVELELAAAAIDFAIVKATATRTVKAEGARTAKKLSIQSLGSASPKNSQVSYYAELAEKWAKSRAILMLMGFYELGIYGEDEAEDFQRKADSLPGAAEAAPTQSVGNGAGGSAMTSEPPALPAASSSAAPAAYTGAEQSIAGPANIPAEIIAKYTRQLEDTTTLAQVVKLWEGLTKNERKALFAVKEAAKARLAPPAAPEAGNLKEAGTDAEAFAEFAQQPTVSGVAYVAPNKDQRETITRLLDHPLITRKEKLAVLLIREKVDTERARQLLTRLRGVIVEREGHYPASEAEQVGEVRAGMLRLLKEEQQYLSEQQEKDLRAVLANAKAPLAELEDALEAARTAVLDGQTYGTEAELQEDLAEASNPYN